MDLRNKLYRSRNKARLNRKLRGIYRIRKIKYSHQLKDERGGRCAICGYNKNYAALVWHHVLEENKELEMSKIIKATGKIEESKIRKEINKCILLCANCHQEVHHPDLKRRT